MKTMADSKKSDDGKSVDQEGPRPGFLARLANAPAFFAEVRQEANKVTWPTVAETRVTTIAVFIMIGLAVVFFAAVDWTLSTIVRFVLNAV
jgi:preprotein translocase subunit SecE